MQKLIMPEDEEKQVAEELRKLDDVISHFRDRIRNGETIKKHMIEERLEALGYI